MFYEFVADFFSDNLDKNNISKIPIDHQTGYLNIKTINDYKCFWFRLCLIYKELI